MSDKNQSVPLARHVAAELRRTAAIASGIAERRVSQSETVAVTMKLAKAHPEEFAALLTATDKSGDSR